MILDCIGVGIIGGQTHLSSSLRRFAALTDGQTKDKQSLLWGFGRTHCSAPMAAYLNAASCHSMDFDDTWHPATHPSSPVLPALLATAGSLPTTLQPTLEDLLIAFNAGVQVQGCLLRCSQAAQNIPNRLHPPAIVGVMGSAAAVSRLLGFGPEKCRHALAIAASFAGAPMANAGTTTKPLHAAKAARFGLEAALLADTGIQGNPNILDMESGFGAYFTDFNPEKEMHNISNDAGVILNEQDIAIKRFPCHLGMHWAIDASTALHKQIVELRGSLAVDGIKRIDISAPKSRYINRPIPESEHEARHSFQFTSCTALLDGVVTPESFQETMRDRRDLKNLLSKTFIQSSNDNKPCFDTMYVEVKVTLSDNTVIQSRCHTPYGHWRNPLSDDDVISKFRNNSTKAVGTNVDQVIKLVRKMNSGSKVSDLEEAMQ
ncbi:hypothetical protein FSP39_003016 [Pinctada imbricata]|uniref:Cis-aconitate decarboxylase n=1 Tax=Pinctada imbricata TaxID=66713 RepID=A0AA88XPF1_PINIB|nr:hypothetical protein FSP39_003016 [Pinctada imbricata]